LENDVVLKLSTESDRASSDIVKLANELSVLSSKIVVEHTVLDRTPSFSVNRPYEDTDVVCAGVPLGHEFTSLVLALLQVGARTPRLDEEAIEQIKALEGQFNFETYVSLTCQVCPEVVQTLNAMTVLNDNIKHTMVDGAVFKQEVESKNILAVPTVY